MLENRREENISVGLRQDKQHKRKQHHGRIHCPGMDWNPKDLGLRKERTPYVYWIQCKLQHRNLWLPTCTYSASCNTYSNPAYTCSNL